MYIYVYIHELVFLGGRHPRTFVRWTFPEKIYGRIPGRTGGLIHHTKRDIVGVARRTCLGGHQIPKNIYKFHRICTKCPPMTVW